MINIILLNKKYNCWVLTIFQKACSLCSCSLFNGLPQSWLYVCTSHLQDLNNYSASAIGMKEQVAKSNPAIIRIKVYFIS